MSCWTPQIQFAVVSILTVYTHVQALYVTVSPTSKSVFVNDTTEFTCTIGDKGLYQLLWIFEFPGEMTRHYVSAEQTSAVQLSNTMENHGTYSREYSTENVTGGTTIHILLLRIDGVLPADAGQFACGYRFPIYPQVTPIGESANLEIVIPPTETLPTCDFVPSSDEHSLMVTLKCRITGGIPQPTVMWYRGNTAIAEPSVELSEVHYELQPNDNGVKFVCTASGPSLAVGGSCSVVPLQVNPSASLSTVTPMPVTENTDLIYTCIGAGISEISKLDWLYNGQAFQDINNMELEYQIVDISDSSSELHVFNVQLDNNNDIITCYVEIPSGLNSEQSVTITVDAEKTTINTTGQSVTTVFFSDQQTTMYIDPTAPSSRAYTSMLTIVIPLGIVCVILLIIVAVFIRCWQMKRRDESPCSPSDPYVISELSREHGTTTTMTTGHLYEDPISPSVDSTSNVDNTVNLSVDHVDDQTPSYERHIPFICIEESRNQNPHNEGIYIDILP